MARDERALEVPVYAAATASVLRLPDGRSELDRLAVEEPLEVPIEGDPIAVTMRTPGHDGSSRSGSVSSKEFRRAPRACPTTSQPTRRTSSA